MFVLDLWIRSCDEDNKEEIGVSHVLKSKKSEVEEEIIKKAIRESHRKQRTNILSGLLVGGTERREAPTE